MTDFKFIHASDLHIDSPLRGLDRYEGAPIEEIRGATRKAFDNLVNLALEKKVNFVLLAGDIFDGAWPDHNTGLYFISKMATLHRAGIRVFIVSGNHDAESRITKRLHFPDNVKQFKSSSPETYKMVDLECAIHGQSFAEAAITENLAASYPTSVPGFLNIGLLHTSVDGREGHASYAPCTLKNLLDKGYDYWALGHIHKREILHENPHVIFPGNTQGRHARETGQKGCSLVSVTGGKISQVEHHNLDVVRWFECSMDASSFSTRDALLSHVSKELASLARKNPDMVLAVRLLFHGKTHAHRDIASNRDGFEGDCREMGISVPGASVWIERVEVNIESPSTPRGKGTDREAMDKIIQRASALATTDEITELLEEVPDMLRTLPPEVRGVEGDPSLTDNKEIQQLVMDALALIETKILYAEKA